MRNAVAILLAALMLSGCMAEWKSPRNGQRWHEGPGTTPPPDVQSGTYATP